MTIEWVIGLGRETMMMIMLISMPMLGVGVIIGILMSIVQTVTAIRDQTLMTVVKIVGVAAALLFSLPWIIRTLVSFMNNLFLLLPTLAGK